MSIAETRAGHLKGMGAPWRDLTAGGRAKEQAIVDAFYDVFVERVAEGRGMSAERVRELATGEVWLARQGVELGLVDDDRRHRAGGRGRRRDVRPPARSAPVRLKRPFFARLVDRFAIAAGCIGRQRGRVPRLGTLRF